MNSSGYEVHFPEYFDEQAPFIEAKGWFADLKITTNNLVIQPVFYDPVRFGQECIDAVNSDQGYLAERRLVIVKSVTRENILNAIERMSTSGFKEILGDVIPAD
jgi:hypothetical protein